MLNYLLKRLLLFIPTLIVISLLAFVISVNAPGDPVERLLTSAESNDIANTATRSMTEEKIYWIHRLGLDLPVFYFSISPLSFPDTLYRIDDKQEREALSSLLYQYGNWKEIQAYHQSLEQLLSSLDHLKIDSGTIRSHDPNELRGAINESRFTTLSLLALHRDYMIKLKTKELETLYNHYSFFKQQQELLLEAGENYNQVTASATSWKNYIPLIHFYPHNQYHRWIFGDGNWLTGNGNTFSKGLIRGDLGMSYTTKMSVNTLIWSRMGWSLLLTLLSVVLAYIISIPIGIRAAVRHGSFFDRSSSVLLFILHSMPAFWVATMLLIIFANPGMLFWFPTSGVKPVTGYGPDASILEKIKLSFPYLVLPTIAYTYGSLAFLSRIMRVSMLDVIHQDYIRTARAKGLTEKMVIYKHALRNALLPLITVLANVLPAAIGGSVILETIFTIPGMGRETYKAIQSQNFPVIIGVFTITGVLTLAGYLLADVVYAFADPRISLSKK